MMAFMVKAPIEISFAHVGLVKIIVSYFYIFL
jgi:hypothetical protein